MKLGRDRGEDRVLLGRRTLEDPHRADVHVTHRVLHVQERGIERAHRLHATKHAASAQPSSLRPTISIAGASAQTTRRRRSPTPRPTRPRKVHTACYALGSADRSSPAMRCAQARISSQSRRSRYSGAIPEAIDFAMKPPPSSGSVPPKTTWSLNAELLHLAEDPGWLQPIGVVVGGIANRARAEHPEGQRGERLAVLAQEVLGVAAPALHVDGTAQDDGVVGCEIADPIHRHAVDAQLGLAKGHGNGIGDLRGRAALGCVGDEDLGHGATIACDGPPAIGPPA